MAVETFDPIPGQLLHAAAAAADRGTVAVAAELGCNQPLMDSVPNRTNPKPSW